MASLLLVDTDILIDAARGDSQALSRLKQEALSATLAVSTVTYLELLVGCRISANNSGPSVSFAVSRLCDLTRPPLTRPWTSSATAG
jgi:predicted nucleic acid-binding protein